MVIVPNKSDHGIVGILPQKFSLAAVVVAQLALWSLLLMLITNINKHKSCLSRANYLNC